MLVRPIVVSSSLSAVDDQTMPLDARADKGCSGIGNLFIPVGPWLPDIGADYAASVASNSKTPGAGFFGGVLGGSG